MLIKGKQTCSQLNIGFNPLQTGPYLAAWIRMGSSRPSPDPVNSLTVLDGLCFLGMVATALPQSLFLGYSLCLHCLSHGFSPANSCFS